jgi:hypothetical protein
VCSSDLVNENNDATTDGYTMLQDMFLGADAMFSQYGVISSNTYDGDFATTPLFAFFIIEDEAILLHYWDFTTVDETFSVGETVVTDSIGGTLTADVSGNGIDLICNTNGLIWADDRTSATKPELKMEGINLNGDRTIEFVYKSIVSVESWNRHLIQFSNWRMLDWNTCGPNDGDTTWSECGLWIRDASTNFIMSMENPWGNTVERDCPDFVHIIMTWVSNEAMFTWYVDGVKVTTHGGTNPHPYGFPTNN